MFTPGPLYVRRKEIVSMLKSVPLQTGDIVYNAADVAGPLGIPFSKLIQYFTKSKYSHGTMVLVEGNETYVVDVSDWGTRKLRLIDWFDNWYMTDFVVYRLKDSSHVDCLENQLKLFLTNDPSYDFNFTDPDAFYCTEAVATMYDKCGLKIGGAFTLREILPPWFYWVVRFGSWVTKMLTNSSLPDGVPIYIVGNENKGMMSSELTQRIFEYSQNLDLAVNFINNGESMTDEKL